MTKERAQELLEDIRPTELRLKQVKYLLNAPMEYNLIQAVSYGEKVATYTTGDNTANTVISKMDRVTDLERERDELQSKLELYSTWINTLDNEIYRDLINDLYIEGHSVNWISISKCYERDTVHKRKSRLLELLAAQDISVVTQRERGRYKFD